MKKSKPPESEEANRIPEDIKPMLATLVSKPVEGEEWFYEVKWDGFRALAYVKNGDVQLRSRNNKSFNDKFYPIYNNLKKLDVEAVFDGEIIVADEEGYPDFAALQTWRSEADGHLVYYIFDLLWLNGRSLMNSPLKERREMLREILPGDDSLKISENFPVQGSEFFSLAEKLGLEGVIAKKADSLYIPDLRSKEWLKIKTVKQQEAIIAGYTRNENSSRKISALLLGLYKNGKLEFIGPVGTGFTEKIQEELLKKLAPILTNDCPFSEVPAYNKPSRFRPDPPKAEVFWAKPHLVAEITYRTVAPDGTFRHPVFKALREDKSAEEVVREIPAQVLNPEKEKNIISVHTASSSGSTERKSLLNPSNESQIRKVCGHDLKFSNLSKVFWLEEGVTKRDMLNYYYQIAPYILPYVKDRPQTLNRYPNGIKGPSFYQKDVTGKIPDWIETYSYFSEADDREKHFMVITDEASLLYMASLGCIEVNPWSSRTDRPGNPDWCVIDLDPDKNTFEQVIQTALVTKKILDEIKIPSYCKTSGSTGLHIYIPLAGKYTYEDSKEFGRELVKIVHKELPDFTSIERKIADRKGKMYLDFLQNRPQATVAAPYSLRPKKGATVSMPLHWDEVKPGLKMMDFNIRNAVERIKAEGEIFSPVLGEGSDIIKGREKLMNFY